MSESTEKKSKNRNKEKRETSIDKNDELNSSKEEERSSSKRKNKKDKSIKEDADEDAEPKAKKDLSLEVHSANNWEEADLGDEKRKMKFLKLMGATKHQDNANVSHKHTREATENEKINKELEKQFSEGLANKFNHAHHTGLGFKSSTAPKEPKNTRIVFNDDDEDDNSKLTQKEQSKKQEKTEKKSEAQTSKTLPSTKPTADSNSTKKDDSKAKFKMMNFVKSSS